MQYLTIDSEIELAYARLTGKGPGIVFCGGFMSDMQGSKAKAIEDFCREYGRAFVRFDYRGHGLSKGNLLKATISDWLTDALAILEHLTQGPQIIIGSSMGAWIAALLTKAKPERVKKLIGIATASDFTENLIWARLPDEMQQQLMSGEILYLPAQAGAKPYPITRRFIEDGRQNLLLKSAIPIYCPVNLLHGMQDEDVPWHTSLQLAEQIESADVKLTLIKDGDHRLAREQDLALIKQAVG